MWLEPGSRVCRISRQEKQHQEQKNQHQEQKDQHQKKQQQKQQKGYHRASD